MPLHDFAWLRLLDASHVWQGVRPTFRLFSHLGLAPATTLECYECRISWMWPTCVRPCNHYIVQFSVSEPPQRATMQLPIPSNRIVAGIPSINVSIANGPHTGCIMQPPGVSNDNVPDIQTQFKCQLPTALPHTRLTTRAPDICNPIAATILKYSNAICQQYSPTRAPPFNQHTFQVRQSYLSPRQFGSQSPTVLRHTRFLSAPAKHFTLSIETRDIPNCQRFCPTRGPSCNRQTSRTPASPAFQHFQSSSAHIPSSPSALSI